MKNIFYNAKEQVRPGFLLLISVLIMFLALFAASFAAGLISVIWPNATIYTSIGSAPATILYSLIYGLCAWWLSKIVFKKLFPLEELAMIDCYSFHQKTWKNLGGGMLLGIVAFIAAVLPLYLTGAYRLEFTGINIIPLLLYLFFFTSVGLLEEVITRGLMQHTLMRYNKWAALVLVSIVFAALHLTNPNVTFASILGIFLAGIFLGMSMYATGSLTVAIGAHITWNWIQSSVLGIPVSGMELEGNVFQTTIVGTNELVTGGAFGAEASLSCFIVLIVISFALYLYMVRSKT